LRTRLSETLIADAGHICCAACSYRLAPANGGWKRSAALSTVAVAALPGAGTNVHPEVVLRRFCCPKCGHLLDTETALPDDPFLEDIVRA
jgi:acetone carboxylase gamma subunit